jgi:hypothetical protein
MLIHNGFVPESNTHNTFKLKLGLSVQDSLYELKAKALTKFGLHT